MARDVLRGNHVPAAMLHCNPRLCADLIESNFNGSGLARRETLLAPGERKPHAWFPDSNTTDLEDLPLE